MALLARKKIAAMPGNSDEALRYVFNVYFNLLIASGMLDKIPENATLAHPLVEDNPAEH